MPGTALEPISFGDGKYQFGPLSLKQVVELERACGVTDREGVLRSKSVYVIYDELGQGLGLNGDAPVYLGGGGAHPGDIREVIRLALIAGNSGVVAGNEIQVGPVKAGQLCDEYLYPERPMIEGQHIAWAVLNAMIVGVTLKKKAETTEEGPESPEALAEA